MDKVGELFSVFLPNIPGQVSPLLRRLVSSGVSIRDTWAMSYGDYKVFYIVPQQGRDSEQMTEIVNHFNYDYKIDSLYGVHIPLEAVEILDWLEEIRGANGLLTAIATVPTDTANTSICLCLAEEYREQAYEVMQQEYPFEFFSDPIFPVFLITLPLSPSLSQLFAPLAESDIAFRTIALGTFQEVRQLYLVPYNNDDRVVIEDALVRVQEAMAGMFWVEIPVFKVVMANRTSIVTAISCLSNLLGINNLTAITTLLVPNSPVAHRLRYSLVERG